MRGESTAPSTPQNCTTGGRTIWPPAAAGEDAANPAANANNRDSIRMSYLSADSLWSGRPAPHRVAAPIEPQAGLVEGRAVAADAVVPENRLHVAREIHFVGRLRDRLEGRHGDEDAPRDPARVHLVPPRKGPGRAVRAYY
jgi:hypothetical protein